MINIVLKDYNRKSKYWVMKKHRLSEFELMEIVAGVERTPELKLQDALLDAVLAVSSISLSDIAITSKNQIEKALYMFPGLYASCKNCRTEDCRFKQPHTLHSDFGYEGCVWYKGPGVIHKTLIQWRLMAMKNRKIDFTYEEFDIYKKNVDSRENARKLQERLTPKEINDVCFIPMVYAEMAWEFAERAISYAIRDKNDQLKKLSRMLKEAHRDYYESVIAHLAKKYHDRLIASTHEYMAEIDHDINILYYGVNQNIKTNNKNKDLPHEEQTTYAVMAMLIVDLLRQHNVEVNKLLSKRLDNMIPSVIDNRILAMYKGMVAYAGTDIKVQYSDVNMNLALDIVKKRVDNLLFTDQLKTDTL